MSIALTTAAAQPAAPALPSPTLRDLAHIPGDDGWPVLGSTLGVLADPLGSARRMVERYGPVYRNHVIGTRNIALMGPQANEFVLFDSERLFSSQLGWDPVLGRLFPRGLMMLDFDEHRRHRRAMAVAFKTAPMQAYLVALNEGIAARVVQWRTQGDGMRVYPAVKQLTLDLAATAFLGGGGGLDMPAVKAAFVAMVAAAVGVVRRPLPGTAMRRGVRGRAAIVAMFSAEIPRRREGDGADIFSQLCRATHEDGALMTAREIVDHMSFLMMAAHDTLTSSMTTLLWKLAAHPEWQERLRAEAQGLGLPPGAPLPYERLHDMPLTEMALKEAMRINPPVPAIPRRAVRAFRFGGYDIPAGAIVGINPLYTHHMPDIWPDPERFDPLRFTEEAVRARHRYAWVPFSGGAHMCIGLHFAVMQMKCMAYHLLTQCELSLAPGYAPQWRLWPIPQPKDGLPVRLAWAG